MKFGHWRFRPGLWPTLATLVVLPVLISLGIWQLERAEQKTRLRLEFERHLHDNPLDLNEFSTADPEGDTMLWRKIRAEGQYDTGIQILLDNQVFRGKPGYFVYTPFKLRNTDTRILINRGWVAADLDRSVLPDIGVSRDRVTISGVAKAPPLPGVLQGTELTENLGNNIYRMQVLGLKEAGRLAKQDLMPYVVRLDADAEGGYIREWRLPGWGRSRHLGYAFQWFAMALVLLIIYIWLNLEKEENDD